MTQETGLTLNNSTVSEILNRPRIDRWAYRGRGEHRPVSFLAESDIDHILEKARRNRNGLRDELILSLLFQGALRVSEALDLRLRDKQYRDGMHLLFVEHGKGDKPRIIAIPEGLYSKIGNYASEKNITDVDAKLFNISRFRVLQIVKKAASEAGINRRTYCHLFRHSGAVARLKRTGNTASLQRFLGHSSPKETLRYLTTLQVMDSLEIESKVTFDE
jgi:integrase/recombinase XerD